jgi:hypothetical protein
VLKSASSRLEADFLSAFWFEEYMLKTKLSDSLRSRPFQLGLAFLVIAFVIWIARFSRASDFGVYEDDWTIVPRAIDMSFSQLVEFISDYISQFRGQGRPFHHSLIYSLSFIGWGIGELGGIYFLGYLIISSNAILFYLLLKRLYNHQFALIGALAYCLYSADSTQAFLTHSLGLHPSLTLFLLAVHAYLSRKVALSYLLIFISLLVYETPYLLFFATPLFMSHWNRRLMKKLLIHVAILATFFISVFVLRVAVGEFRVSSLSYSEALSTSIRHMLQGPIYNLGSIITRARQTYWALDQGITKTIFVTFPVFFSMLLYWAIDRSSELKTSVRLNEKPTSNTILEKFRFISTIQSSRHRKLFKLLAISILLLVLAYPLTFTSQPELSFGRVTRNHFAGIVGSSMLIGCIWMILTEVMKTKWVRLTSALFFALIFSILVGFGQIVQRDYVAGWKYQQEFWSALLELIPDADDGTAIIVDPSGMKEPIHILANTWNMPRVLGRIVEFPEEWDVPPSVYKMQVGWQEHVHDGNGTLRLDNPVALTSAEHIRDVDSGEMILIVTVEGTLARQNSPIVVNDSVYPLKSPSESVIAPFRRRTFYDVLILNPNE